MMHQIDSICSRWLKWIQWLTRENPSLGGVEMSARPDIRQISLSSAAGPPTGASGSSAVTGPPGGPNGPVQHSYHNIHTQRHPITQR